MRSPAVVFNSCSHSRPVGGVRFSTHYVHYGYRFKPDCRPDRRKEYLTRGGRMLRRYRGTILTLAVLFGLLAWAIWTMIQMWTSVEGDMGTHEWIALVLGVFFSCLVGFGLMGLMFFSSREGYDEPPTYTREDENHDEDDSKGPSC
jgi:hypothetical protein